MNRFLIILSLLVALFSTVVVAVPRAEANSTSFVDVPVGSFFHEPVAWLVAQGITNGTSPTTFSPDRGVTRGEMAAFLWRRAGKPSAVTSCGFSDVPANAFYASATCWLVAQGITNGTSPTTFSPNRSVTRGEMAAFLWRSAGRPEVFFSHYFEDVNSTAFYEVAVR